jgi:hypothetical protein
MELAMFSDVFATKKLRMVTSDREGTEVTEENEIAYVKSEPKTHLRLAD